MRNTTCAKLVDQAGTLRRKVGAVLSTHTRQNLQKYLPGSAQLVLLPDSFPTFPPPLSPAKKLSTSPFEHYFYPVSTAPITNYNQIKSKER